MRVEARKMKTKLSLIKKIVRSNSRPVKSERRRADLPEPPQELLAAAAAYIDEHYGKTADETAGIDFKKLWAAAPDRPTMMMDAGTFREKAAWEKILSEMDAGFSETLLRLIDRSGRRDSEVYKKAGVDRKLFSKIRKNRNYQPSKPTALAFAFALELSLDETEDLLARAGYALSHSSKFDIIVEYFIINGNYDIFQLNQVLYAFDQPLV